MYAWAPAGGQGGHLPPLEFEKMTSYAAVLQNILKFSLAPSALAIDTLYFSLKCHEKTQQFSFAPWARRKMIDFLYGAPKTCQLFKVTVVLPPSGKISAGAHATIQSCGTSECVVRRLCGRSCPARPDCRSVDV